MIATLYIAGMVLPFFAAAAVAEYFGRSRSLLARVGIYVIVVLAFVLFVTTISEAVEVAFGALTGVSEYAATEVPIALIGVAWLLVGYWVYTRSGGRRDTSAI